MKRGQTEKCAQFVHNVLALYTHGIPAAARSSAIREWYDRVEACYDEAGEITMGELGTLYEGDGASREDANALEALQRRYPLLTALFIEWSE